MKLSDINHIDNLISEFNLLYNHTNGEHDALVRYSYRLSKFLRLRLREYK